MVLLSSSNLLALSNLFHCWLFIESLGDANSCRRHSLKSRGLHNNAIWLAGNLEYLDDRPGRRERAGNHKDVGFLSPSQPLVIRGREGWLDGWVAGGRKGGRKGWAGEKEGQRRGPSAQEGSAE